MEPKLKEKYSKPASYGAGRIGPGKASQRRVSNTTRCRKCGELGPKGRKGFTHPRCR